MSCDFTMLSLANDDSEIKVNKLAKRLPNNLYRKYLLKKLPVTITYISYVGEKVQNIILPFTQNDVDQLEAEYIKELIKKTLMMYNVISVYIPDNLKKYIEMEKVSYQSLLKYMVLDQIIERVRMDLNLDWKNIRLVIVDSEDSKTDYILEMLIKELNYLLIITKRQEYFDEFKDIIYNNTGLVVETTDNPLKGKIEGNLIIDANKNLCKNYSYFKENAIIIDLESSPTKIQYQYSRRKDLTMIYDVKLTARGENVDNDLFGQVLCSKSWLCANFVRNSYRAYPVNDILQVARMYDISLKEIKKT